LHATIEQRVQGFAHLAGAIQLLVGPAFSFFSEQM
jgi:hypothetical protein